MRRLLLVMAFAAVPAAVSAAGGSRTPGKTPARAPSLGPVPAISMPVSASPLAAPVQPFVSAGLAARVASWIPFLRPRAAPASPVEAVDALIAAGEYNKASESLETLARSDDFVIHGEGALAALKRLRAAKSESYGLGEMELQEPLAVEAVRLEAAGKLSGFGRAATAVQKGGTCLFCATDNAVRASVGYAREGVVDDLFNVPAWVRVDPSFKEPGVSDNNVEGFLRLVGLSPRKLSRAEIAPEILAAHLKRRQPVIAVLSVPQFAGVENWRHVVFARSIFKSRAAGGWVVAVQDSAKGRIEYYSWKRFANLASAAFLAEAKGPIAVPWAP